MAGDAESGGPEGRDPFGSAGEESEPANGEEDEEPGLDAPEASEIEMGAALEVDEDAMAAAAGTPLDMEGFETGAGFDLEDPPAEMGQDLEVEALAIESSVFEELAEDEIPSAAEPGAGDLVAGGEDGGLGDVDLAAASTAETVAGADAEERGDDATVEGGDEEPRAAPTPAADKPVRESRLLGLEELERRRKRTVVRRRLLTAASTVLIVGGGGFAMAYWGVVQIAGITPPDRFRFAVPPPVTLPGPQPETPVMTHVLFVDTWREAETPLAMVAALRERMPELLSFVTALSVDGDRQYALMVGPAYNAVEANDLKGPLATALDLLNPDPESWTVRETPYSFFFGEYETLGGANGRVQELADVSISAYVLQVRYSAGASALRVYGGAFSDELQAGRMGQLLSQNDLEDSPLIERHGRMPE